MDPNATLSRLLDALGTGDRAEASEAISALYEWIAKGGMLPDDPRPTAAAKALSALHELVAKRGPPTRFSNSE
jgi:hypothetical protein